MGITFSVVRLHGVPVLRQLQIEEALFRAGTGNWCLINDGTDPAIVLGISGSPDEVRDSCPYPLVRRFSGGGTVVVDEGTVFCSLIFDQSGLPVPSTPRDVMQWSRELFRPAFLPHELVLEEQDYVLDGQKVGGTAQSFSRNRGVHHVSFLWSWQEERMAFLRMPRRQPVYRAERGHGAFCNRLSRYFPSRNVFIDALLEALEDRFDCRHTTQDEAEEALALPHRTAVSRCAKISG